jgi:cyclic-di-AMP phosphodiesterase
VKRWLLLGAAVIILIGSILLYLPFINFNQEGQIAYLIVFLVAVSSNIVVLYVFINYRFLQKIKTLQNRLSMWTKLSYHVNQVGDEVFNELPIGILACDEDDEVKWANPHAQQIFGSKIINKHLRDVNQTLYLNQQNSKMNFTITVGDFYYDVIYRPEYRFFYLFNTTEKEQIKEKYNNQIPALGIIYIDNLDETLATLDVSEQSSLKGAYLGALADWAASYDVFLKPYGDERLMIVCYRKELNQMIVDKFNILDKVRSISNDYDVRVSLSIGFASWDISYDELGVYAQNALELAEKRGGDQVVVNIQDQKIAYFGAKSESSAKSSKVGARINAQTIRDFIAKANKIYIMGHNQADLDAFGAMIAVFRMAETTRKTATLIIDEDKLDQSVKHILPRVKDELPDLIEQIITSEKALEEINDEALLIVVDTQSPKVTMCPGVLDKTDQIIVIDHHRVGEDGFNAMFTYVEPGASSTVELVMELLNFYQGEDAFELSTLEANIMYAGLIVDTNNFTFRTSARTFEVASKLNELGAEPTEVKTWLRRDLMRTLEINKLLSEVEIYLNRFAFIVTNEIYDDRILLAQASEAALQINGIDAAFTIARITSDAVGVSARSYQNVNVQMIMELIGGGGHLNSAAAQIKNESISGVLNKLKEIVEMEYGLGDEKMKIILLEDVKGKGNKDSVIEVANGYGQFLITQKKAIIASDENIAAIKKRQEDAEAELKRHLDLMKKLKSEIDHKKITVGIQIGQDGKLFGSVTTKQITEAFEKEHGITIDKKKLELSSDINSVGIYTATVTLHKDVKAQFEVHIIEK